MKRMLKRGVVLHAIISEPMISRNIVQQNQSNGEHGGLKYKKWGGRRNYPKTLKILLFWGYFGLGADVVSRSTIAPGESSTVEVILLSL